MVCFSPCMVDVLVDSQSCSQPVPAALARQNIKSLMALIGGREALWLRKVLNYLGRHVSGPVVVQRDNTCCSHDHEQRYDYAEG